jgi:hypothetical protein
VDALEKADPFLRIPGTKDEGDHADGLYKISECVFDPMALSNLNDSVIYLIETSTMPELKPAQEVLMKIRTRQFVRVFVFIRFYCSSLLTFLR